MHPFINLAFDTLLEPKNPNKTLVADFSIAPDSGWCSIQLHRTQIGFTFGYMRIKNSCILLFIGISLNAFSQSAVRTPGWEMYFSEEFNSIDPAIWKVHNNDDANSGIRPLTSPNRKLVHTSRPENVRCESGNLIIRVRAENYSCPLEARKPWGCSVEEQTGQPYVFTSGLVEKVEPLQYGIIEARVKIPDLRGLNSAYWLLNGAPPYQEIDIFEMIPGARPPGYADIHDKFLMTSNWHYITRVPNSTEGQSIITKVQDYTLYHNYAVEWTPTKIIFYLDGKVIGNTIHQNTLRRFLWPIFSIGFSDYLEPLPSTFPAEMKVDWIRAYKLTNGPSTSINTCLHSFNKSDYIVKKQIVIGGSGCENRIPEKADVYMRAEDGIEIKGDFTIPLGSEFFLDSNPVMINDN